MLTRILKVVLGLILMVVGAALGALPFLPGWPLGILGLGLVLAQSEPGRRTLTRLRLYARRRFGPDVTRRLESRLPKDVIGPQDTVQMHLDLEAYAKERAKRDKRSKRR